MRGLWLACLLVSGTAAVCAGQERPALSAEERTLLRLLNESRALEKLPPLVPDLALCRMARSHSANMARQQILAHVLDGKGPSGRLAGLGPVGENIAFDESEPGAALPLGEVHSGWMKSELERANILSREFGEVGLGLARNARGEVYYCQVFRTRGQKR